MTVSESARDSDGQVDESSAADGDQPVARSDDAMVIEIAGNSGGHITVGAGRTRDALVAVVGATIIVAILASPQLGGAVTSGLERRLRGREDDGAKDDGDAAEESSPPPAAGSQPER